MTVQEWLRKPVVGRQLRPRLECVDGFSVSVQASDCHYCSPRKIGGDYTHVELGFPSDVEELILDYAENFRKPRNTVYGYVPIELVQKMIEKHGGIKEVAK